MEAVGATYTQPPVTVGWSSPKGQNEREKEKWEGGERDTSSILFLFTSKGTVTFLRGRYIQNWCPPFGQDGITDKSGDVSVTQGIMRGTAGINSGF